MEKIQLNENYHILKFTVGFLETNCYIVVSKNKNAAIIDPGNYDDNIIDYLKKENIEVKLVLLTHGHFDHILGLNMFEPVTPVYINNLDAAFLNDEEKNAAMFYNLETKYIPKNLKTFKDNDVINFEEDKFKVISAPGHTKGSSIFMFLEDVLFTGDALFKENVGRFDLFSGSKQDTKKTIEKIAALSHNFKIFPGHGDITTLNHEKKYNRYFSKHLNNS